jgi:hypothetical protein
VTHVRSPDEAVAPVIAQRRAALVVAHPGHELRVHGWLEVVRPIVCVLTDGSGHAAPSRLASTSAILERTGAIPGPVYGRLTDRALYAAILGGDDALFAGIAAELASALGAADVDYVVTDALEGYNPGHDLCHVLVAAAVALLARRRPVAAFDFPLVGPPDACPPAGQAGAVTLTLAADAFARKLAAAAAYAELAGEVTRALGDGAIDASRCERLRPVPVGPSRGAPPENPPYYERYGERRVEAGRYGEVLRWRAHMAPLVDAVLRRLELEV